MAILASHPARGEWIEIDSIHPPERVLPSHPARGEWIEIYVVYVGDSYTASHPARGEWIEMCWQHRKGNTEHVSPREG